MPPVLSKERVCNILVIGKTGVGKSATLNTILGEKYFRSDSGDSVTKGCSSKEKVIYGMNIRLIDTPGSMDVEGLDVTEIIDRYILENTEGIDVFVLVLTVASRATDEEIQVLEMFRDQLGPGLTTHLLIIVTRADELENKTVEKFLQSYAKKNAAVCKCLQKKRVLGINNKAQGEERDRRLKEFVTIVQNIISENDGQFFSHAMLKKQQQEAEEKRKQKEAQEKEEQERQEKIKKDHEETQKELEKTKQQLQEAEEKRKQKETQDKEEQKRQEETQKELEKTKQQLQEAEEKRKQQKKEEQERQDEIKKELKKMKQRNDDLESKMDGLSTIREPQGLDGAQIIRAAVGIPTTLLAASINPSLAVATANWFFGPKD